MIQRVTRPAMLLGGVMLAFAAGVGSVIAAEPIKIGAFLAVSGPASFLGDPEKKTLELYVEKLNESGGILGRPFKLIAYDTGGDAKQAATFARRLIEEDKVDFLIGGSTTGDTMAAIPLVERAQIPFISLGGASVIVDPVKKWVFKTPHSDRMAVEKVYADLKKRGLSKVGLIAGDGGFDKSCMENANDKKLLGQWGISVAASETYSKDDKDTTPQLTKLKSAPGIQAIFFCGFGAASVIVTKNYSQLGLTVPLYHNHGSGSKQFIDGAGAAANGVRLPAAALIVADQLPGTDPQKIAALQYTKTYKQKYKEAISTFGGHAYDALFLFVDAIKRAGSIEPAKVRDALESAKNFVGVDGIFNMTPQDHNGLDLSAFKIVEVKDGNWKFLY